MPVRTNVRYDNIWFTTQPLDYPENKLELTRALGWMEAEKILLFSSDYPHWTFDDPQWVAKHIPAPMRENIMFGNALDLFQLPGTVPALAGQKRPFWPGRAPAMHSVYRNGVQSC